MFCTKPWQDGEGVDETRRVRWNGERSLLGPLQTVCALVITVVSMMKECRGWRSWTTVYCLRTSLGYPLTAMVKDGSIPGVVHEPPLGIRLVGSPDLPRLASSNEASGMSQESIREGSEKELGTAAAAAAPGTVYHGSASCGPRADDTGANEAPTECTTSTAGSSYSQMSRTTMDSGVNGRGQLEEAAGKPWGGNSNTSGNSNGNSGRAVRRGAADLPKAHREADWKELTRNLNVLLMEEGALTSQELQLRFSKRFRKVCVLR